jgi:hypothetical protein
MHRVYSASRRHRTYSVQQQQQLNLVDKVHSKYEINNQSVRRLINELTRICARETHDRVVESAIDR